MKKFYAGIGSRTISKSVYKDMTAIATSLEEMGYWLRSGNAIGSDQAFASGVKTNAQIWLPWKDFEKEFSDKHPEHTYKLVGDECCPGEPDPEAWDSVEKFHPNFKNMKKLENTLQAEKYYNFMRFMSRNYRQVIGWGELDSRFVICWTHDGTDVGGTGQAIRIADYYDIPVYNLFKHSKDEIMSMIERQMFMYDYLDD